MIAVGIAAAFLAVITAAVATGAALSRRFERPVTGDRKVLVPFTGSALESRVLEAALRVSRAEHATLVPAYLMVVPLRLPLDAPMSDAVEQAIPLLEAIEHRALRAGVPVDSRIEKGRSATHALSQVWSAERFDRIIAPAPQGPGGDGFTLKDMTWILANAPAEALVLRPLPAVPETGRGPRLSSSRALVKTEASAI
jgi:universal stress protein family protein